MSLLELGASWVRVKAQTVVLNLPPTSQLILTKDIQTVDNVVVMQYPLRLLASFPGPIYERMGPGTHCLRMCRVSMVIHTITYTVPHIFLGVTMEIQRMRKQCVPGNEATRL